MAADAKAFPGGTSTNANKLDCDTFSARRAILVLGAFKCRAEKQCSIKINKCIYFLMAKLYFIGHFVVKKAPYLHTAFAIA
jgi:hypothetical protein